jgi:hypothetical protein
MIFKCGPNEFLWNWPWAKEPPETILYLLFALTEHTFYIYINLAQSVPHSNANPKL